MAGSELGQVTFRKISALSDPDMILPPWRLFCSLNAVVVCPLSFVFSPFFSVKVHGPNLRQRQVAQTVDTRRVTLIVTRSIRAWSYCSIELFIRDVTFPFVPARKDNSPISYTQLRIECPALPASKTLLQLCYTISTALIRNEINGARLIIVLPRSYPRSYKILQAVTTV